MQEAASETRIGRDSRQRLDGYEPWNHVHWAERTGDFPRNSIFSLYVGTKQCSEAELQMALRNGASVEEICEAIFQVAAYASFAAAWDALEKLQEVLGDDQKDIEAVCAK